MGDDRSTLSDGEASRARSSLKSVLRPVFALTACGFVVYAAYDLVVSWDGARVDVDLGFFAASLVSASVAMIIQLYAWRALIKNMTGATMPPRQSARLFLDSQMARYTPGKVGLPVVRIGGAEKVGVAPSTMGAALFAEVISWAGVGSAVGGLVLFSLPAAAGVSKELSWSSLLVGSGALCGLLVAVSVDRRRFGSKVVRLAGAGRGPIVPLALPALHCLHFGSWVVCGALICRAVGGDWNVAWVAGALLCLAIVAGFVALLAPAGAGVREAVMAMGLAPLLGPSASVAVGILARVVSLLSDAILWGWFRLRARQEP